MVRISIILLFVFVLSGCASSTTYLEWNKETRLWEKKWRVESKGNVKTEVLADGTVKQDSKNEPIIKLEMPMSKLGG